MFKNNFVNYVFSVIGYACTCSLVFWLLWDFMCKNTFKRMDEEDEKESR